MSMEYDNLVAKAKIVQAELEKYSKIRPDIHACMLLSLWREIDDLRDEIKDLKREIVSLSSTHYK